jgi:hypothetical protein
VGTVPADYTYLESGTVFRFGDLAFMRGLIAGLIAAAILWTLDVELNDGRYTAVMKQAAFSFVGR